MLPNGSCSCVNIQYPWQSSGLLIVGSSGFVGSALFREAGKTAGFVAGTYCHTPCDKRNMLWLDLLEDPKALALPKQFTTLSSKAAVICACISQVDLCARHREASHKVNVAHTIKLIDLLSREGFRIVYVSTDYVFDGKRGDYTESDRRSPINEYGRQKVAVEDYLLAKRSDSLIVRLSKVCAEYDHPKNLFTTWTEAIGTARRIRCIRGQRFSPSASGDIAKTLLLLTAKGCSGVYHVAGSSWRSVDLALYFVKRLRRHEDVEVCELDHDQFSFWDPRPLNTSLDTQKLMAVQGLRFQPMEEVIDGFVTSGKIRF